VYNPAKLAGVYASSGAASSGMKSYFSGASYTPPSSAPASSAPPVVVAPTPSSSPYSAPPPPPSSAPAPAPAQAPAPAPAPAPVKPADDSPPVLQVAPASEAPAAPSVAPKVHNSVQPPSGGGLYAITYTPYDAGGGCKTGDVILSDLQDIKSKGFPRIRMYSTDCGQLSLVANQAIGLGFRLTLGIFIDGSGAIRGNSELDQLIAWGNWGSVDIINIGMSLPIHD
jgi:hypothetical protein